MSSEPVLDARIRFDARGQDENGDPIGSWVEGPELWARIDYLRGSEVAISNRLEGRQPVTITVRDSTAARGITNAHRAVLISGRQVRIGQQFNLTSVAPAREIGFISVLGTAGGVVG